MLYAATIYRALVGDKKIITWSISEVPFAGYLIKNIDTDQAYVTLDGQSSVTVINPTFRFLGDPSSMTVKVEISNISLEHGGYIVSADPSGGLVLGGTILAVEGELKMYISLYYSDVHYSV